MLKNIVADIMSYPGLTRKKDINLITDMIKDVADFGNTSASFGEDAAAIGYNGRYILLAADGILPALIEANPYNAGKASVMVNVNDIYAMGGRPLAMVNVIGMPCDKYYSEVMRGIKRGCEKFKVPMVGGHLHPDTNEASLTVAIMGIADKLILSSNAQAGQDILLAVDLQGTGYQCKPVISWDTNSGKTPEQVIERLEVLPSLAEQGLCVTGKDVSNAGLLGTIAIFMETSEKGAEIDIEKIPKPDSFPLNDWLKAFLSYGFVLCVDKEKTESVVAAFTEKSITASVIGRVTEEKGVTLLWKGERELLRVKE